MGIEKLTTLAFSMYTNKGAYALLLGSGISRSAHIPSGWEVEEKLIQKLGASQGIIDSDDWHQWYKDKYQQSASYSSLLGEIVKTPTERVQLMKSFFEPTDEENEVGWKTPTKAHLSIARLAKKGYVRVILTTNFDRLLEKAFDLEGVTPQVISHEGAISQATPIVHSKIPTIIKINGDYIDCQFRNTTKELDEYPEQMKLYLHRIFEEYGLVTCGWSGEWDKGLIEIINGTRHSRYNSFFAYVGEAKNNIISLLQNRLGELMPIENADNLFSELYEQIMALEKYDANANMNHEIMMERLKKYLSSKQYDIEFADIIEKWRTEAYNQITEVAHYNFQLSKEVFERYLELHLRAIAPLLDAAILTARWGKEWHIKLFGEILIKLCIIPMRNGDIIAEGTQYLHALAPMLLLNTIGIACVKYGRFKELNNILSLSVPAGNFMGFYREPLLSLLGGTHWTYETWNDLMGTNYYYPFSIFFLWQLEPIFKDYFITNSEYENVFYIWEHLKSLVYGYNKCSLIEFSVPMGNFLYKRKEYKKRYKETEPYTLFFEEADKLKNNWEPIKQGMFGGSYDNYKQIHEQAEAYYQQYREY
ncbi:SIR2 family protein [Hoylesella nanceiensis]|uniref:SIR2 family protein n=1 Tax=Hoylesella nanceiensis TaxID=425941 RepID=UPI0028F0899A|nr:SIR2 family protein [Hoylesella nanceiensis]